MTSLRFSIIIPAWNAEDTIETSLQAIKANDYPADRYDIMVADNGSTDGTVALARSQGIEVLECGREAGVGVSAMRNQGAGTTQGEILVFIDADVVIPENFLSTAARFFNDRFRGVLGFVDQPPREAGWVGRVWDGVQILKRPRLMTVDNLPGRNLVVNRSVFNTIQGFKENLSAGEDKDFCMRADRAGYDVVSLPAPNPIHLKYDPDLITFIRKEFWRQGSTLEMAAGQGHSLRNLRHPLLSFWHLVWGSLFGAALPLPDHHGWTLLALVLWLLPSIVIAVRTVGNQRTKTFLLLYLMLTFIRWNTAGIALVRQVLKRTFNTQATQGLSGTG